MLFRSHSFWFHVRLQRSTSGRVFSIEGTSRAVLQGHQEDTNQFRGGRSDLPALSPKRSVWKTIVSLRVGGLSAAIRPGGHRRCPSSCRREGEEAERGSFVWPLFSSICKILLPCKGVFFLPPSWAYGGAAQLSARSFGPLWRPLYWFHSWDVGGKPGKPQHFKF